MQSVRTLLKREESYAIHALLDIASNPGTNAAAIAGRLELPKAFMAKVLRKLVEMEFVESQMGRKGGVWLRKPLADVTLLQVVEAMSGPFVIDTCQAEVLCATQRRKGHCRLNLAYHSAGDQIRTLLDGIGLGTLAAAPRSVAPPTAGGAKEEK